MKSGVKIKAFVKIGLMKKPRWIVGEYVGQRDNNHEVKVAGQNLVLAWNEVKLWEPAEYKDGFCTTLEEFSENNWERLKTVVNDAVGHFFPGESVEVDENERTITVAGVSVAAGVTETETIASFRELPCYIVSYYQHIPATYWEPPDAEEVVCGSSPNPISVARILVDSIWKFKADGYWENMFNEIET